MGGKGRWKDGPGAGGWPPALYLREKGDGIHRAVHLGSYSGFRRSHGLRRARCKHLVDPEGAVPPGTGLFTPALSSPAASPPAMERPEPERGQWGSGGGLTQN